MIDRLDFNNPSNSSRTSNKDCGVFTADLEDNEGVNFECLITYFIEEGQDYWECFEYNFRIMSGLIHIDPDYLIEDVQNAIRNHSGKTKHINFHKQL